MFQVYLFLAVVAGMRRRVKSASMVRALTHVFRLFLESGCRFEVAYLVSKSDRKRLKRLRLKRKVDESRDTISSRNSDTRKLKCRR